MRILKFYLEVQCTSCQADTTSKQFSDQILPLFMNNKLRVICLSALQLLKNKAVKEGISKLHMVV